ncbi:MAG: NAD(P)/FAD-dependent oxidoreductase [Bacteroidota bacterium]
MMTRKEFLKNMTTLGLASPFLATLLASCNDKAEFFQDIESDFQGSVLIIGAGAAGLTAGHLLHQQNINFQILEAAPTHGGRVKKMGDFVDFPIDLGAEWIHTDPSILATLLNDPTSTANIDIITYNPQTISVWKKGQLKKRNFFSNFYSEYKFKSSTWFDFFDQLIVPNIQDRIHYSCPVKAVNYEADKVVIKTNAGDVYEADKVLVTVPITILQNNLLTFTPELPASKINAINEEWMPDGLKVFIEFSERFYPDVVMFDNLLEAAANSNHTYYNAAFGKETNKNVFALFTVGEPAQRYTARQTDQAIFELVMEELDEIFGGKASQFYVKHVVQNWSAEPFVQGSYSHGGADVEELARPVANKVYFAGEAMNTKGNTSTVHGAGESAYLALEELLRQG